MNELKAQLQNHLVANVIIDKCATNKNIVFNQAWCSQNRIIRFTTPFFRKIFKTIESTTGFWETGDIVMYEIYISYNALAISCLFCDKGITKENKKVFKILCENDLCDRNEQDLYVLGKWTFELDENIDTVFAAFDGFIKNELEKFENGISYMIETAKKENDIFLEGKQEDFLGTKYERNPKARAACLEYYGYTCTICGMNFEKVYGAEFAGIIEVHHIVPLYQIGKEYVVDPINDLVPLCPNCHTAIHSKQDGVYTVEEIKNKLI